MPGHPHRRTIIRPLLAIALLLTLCAPTRLAIADPPTWRDKNSPFGIVVAIGNRVRTDEIPPYVGLLREAGAQWTREEFFWDRIQHEPSGPYTWNGDSSGLYDYDRSVDTQANAGLHILGLLDYNPAWFKGQSPPPDAWISDWGDYVYQVVARYGRDRRAIKHWEIWNEPNLTISGYESGLYTIPDYARLLKVAHDAAKAADPEATIVLGGLASVWSYPPSPTTYDYFDYLDALGKLGAWADFDIVAIHPYRADSPEGAPWRRDHAATFIEEMRHLDAIMQPYGSKPVWLTEIGWASSRSDLGVSEDEQAQFLARTYIIALAQPNIEKIFWYDFRNDTTPGVPYEQPTYNDHYAEFHYGLLRRTFPLNPANPALRKPAFVAYRTLTNLLAGLTLQDTIADGQRNDMPNTYWYRFGGTRRVDVLWNTDTPNQIVDIACNCREALIRHWNGRAHHLLIAQSSTITLPLDEQGSPIYIEYDPPIDPTAHLFPATGHTLRGAFRSFWETHGALARFGYPITEEIIEPEAKSGQTRTVQYFERARFEHFPEYTGTPYEVQLGLLGDALLQHTGIDWHNLPRTDTAPPECLWFAETGHTLCPPYRATWERLGGLALNGFPITEPFIATRPDTGQPYTIQYFERARFEHFPEYTGTPYEVQLGLLGREQLTP